MSFSRATQMHLAGFMRPAGRVFETPALILLIIFFFSFFQISFTLSVDENTLKHIHILLVKKAALKLQNSHFRIQFSYFMMLKNF